MTRREWCVPHARRTSHRCGDAPTGRREDVAVTTRPHIRRHHVREFPQERMRSDECLERRHGETRCLGHDIGEMLQRFGPDAGRHTVQHLEGHDDLFEGGEPRAIRDAVDRYIRVRAPGRRGDRCRRCETEIIVHVHGDEDRLRETRAQTLDEDLDGLERKHVGGVSKTKASSSMGDCDLADAHRVLEIGTSDVRRVDGDLETDQREVVEHLLELVDLLVATLSAARIAQTDACS
jgi:hypothetical protein